MANKLFSLLLLTVAVLLSTPSRAIADVEKLGQYTIIAMSVDDWQEMKAEGGKSDFSQFLAEPSIQEIGNRLFDGISKMISNEMSMEENQQKGLDFLKTLGTRWYAENTGQLVVGLGYEMDPNMGFPMPSLILDFNGPADLGPQHLELLTLIREQAGEEVGLIPTAFSIGEMEFNGLAAMPGTGVFIGQQETRHLVGTSKKAIENYLREGDTAVGANFGSTKIFKAAENNLRRGGSSSYLNMDAVWNLTPLIDMMNPPREEAGEEDESMTVSKVISSLGIESISGFASRSYVEDGGSGSDSILAMNGRPGILTIIPKENGNISIPGFVSAKSASVSITRLNFDTFVDDIIEMVATMNGDSPDEFRAMLDIQMEMMAAQMGVNPMELLDAMEGTICVATPPAPENSSMAMNPMEMMMGQGSTGNVMIKMSDRKVFEKLMGVLAGPEMMGSMIKKDSFMDLDVWTYDPLGDMPPEFAGQGPALAPSWTMSDDWFVLSFSSDDLKDMIRTSQGEGEKFLEDRKINKVMKQVMASQGVSLSFTNLGEGLAGAADVLRPVLGFLPLMSPELGQNEDLLFLFDPSNIPESEIFRKYFGWTGGRVSVVEDGLKIYSFSERMMASDSEEKSSEEKSTEKKKKEVQKF
ncbi:MAG: hypothetical protein GWP41_04135 [Planctomycetia bacterium]|nr:hypothetical protein [Planctomycetia bacterium]